MAPLSPLPQPQQADRSIPRFCARLRDPRRAHRRLPLVQDIRVIALGAVSTGAQDGQPIETFGPKRRGGLDGFLKVPNGIPWHDTCERVVDRLQPQAFPACFREGLRAVRSALRIKHGAMDGQTLCGCGAAKRGPLHRVSAGATGPHLSRGPVAGDAPSKETRPSRPCWNCWTATAPWRPGTPWVARRPSPGRA